MKFLNIESDLTLMNNKTEKVCFAIVSIMMFIVTMAVANSHITNILLKNNPESFANKLIVEFAPISIDNVDGILTEKEKGSVMSILKDTNGVSTVKLISQNDMKNMVEEFIPGVQLPKNMPFPTIFEVNVNTSSSVDVHKLSKDLSQINQNVRIYNHSDLANSTIKLTIMFKTVSICLSILAMLAICFVAYYLMTSSVSENSKVLRMLKSLGATNSYIFKQFKNMYTVFGIKASIGSVLLSLATFTALYSMFNVDNSYYYLSICSCFTLLVPVMMFGLMLVVSRIAATRSIASCFSHRGV